MIRDFQRWFSCGLGFFLVLLALSPTLEESARVLGRSAVETFRSVTLPQLRAAIGSGGLLVFLYTVSELGVIDS